MAEKKLNEILGVCHILVGDPTKAAGAGMTSIGETRGDVTVSLELLTAYARSDQAGAVPLASSAYTSGVRPTVTVPLYPASRTILSQLLPGSKIVTDALEAKSALAFGSPGRIPEEDIPTMVLVPVDQLADGIDAEDAVWLPAMGVIEAGQLVFALPEGDDAGSPMSYQLASLHRKTDQSGEPIMKVARNGWMGPPAAVGLADWTLPDLTEL
jgi:hypothetical protein